MDLQFLGCFGRNSIETTKSGVMLQPQQEDRKEEKLSTDVRTTDTYLNREATFNEYYCLLYIKHITRP